MALSMARQAGRQAGEGDAGPEMKAPLVGRVRAWNCFISAAYAFRWKD